MNYKTTVLLVVLLVIVGLFFLWARDRTPDRYVEEGPTPRAEGEALFSAARLPAQDVESVIVRRGEKSATLQRLGDDWWLTAPVRFPLNAWSAQAIVQEAQGLRYVDKFLPGKNNNPSLAEVSLEPALASVKLVGTAPGGDEGVQETLELGRKTIGGRAYLRLGADAYVYVVPDQLHNLVLDADWSDWRSRSIEVPSAGQASRVVLAHGQEIIDLYKAEGRWFLAAPSGGRVDAEALTQWLGAVGATSISGFAADTPGDLARFGLGRPQVALTIRTTPPDEAPAEYTLRVGRAADAASVEHFATWNTPKLPDTVVFTIHASDLDKLRKSVDELRDARISVIPAANVRELEIRRPGQAWRLVWTAKGWVFGDPAPSFAADKALALSLAQSLAEVKAQGYLPGYQPASDPVLELSVTAVGADQPEVLRVYGGDGQDQPYVVLRDDETVGYQVAAEKLAPLMRRPIALRERTVWEIAPADVQALRLTQSDGTELRFARDEAAEDRWRLDGHERFESAALDEILRHVAPLKAVNWDKAGAPAGDSLVHLQVQTRDGTWRNLMVDSATRHAGSPTVDHPFEAGPALVESLGAELRDRTVLPVGPGDIREVVVRRGGRTWTITRDGTGRYMSAQGDELNQTAAAGLWDALAGLRALRFVSAAGADQMTIDVTTTDGKRAHLAIGSAAQADLAVMSGDLGERRFRVAPETLRKLTAELSAKLNPAPVK